MGTLQLALWGAFNRAERRGRPERITLSHGLHIQAAHDRERLILWRKNWQPSGKGEIEGRTCGAAIGWDHVHMRWRGRFLIVEPVRRLL